MATKNSIILRKFDIETFNLKMLQGFQVVIRCNGFNLISYSVYSPTFQHKTMLTHNTIVYVYVNTKYYFFEINSSSLYNSTINRRFSAEYTMHTGNGSLAGFLFASSVQWLHCLGIIISGRCVTML